MPSSISHSCRDECSCNCSAASDTRSCSIESSAWRQRHMRTSSRTCTSIASTSTTRSEQNGADGASVHEGCAPSAAPSASSCSCAEPCASCFLLTGASELTRRARGGTALSTGGTKGACMVPSPGWDLSGAAGRGDMRASGSACCTPSSRKCCSASSPSDALASDTVRTPPQAELQQPRQHAGRHARHASQGATELEAALIAQASSLTRACTAAVSLGQADQRRVGASLAARSPGRAPPVAASEQERPSRVGAPPTVLAETRRAGKHSGGIRAHTQHQTIDPV